MTGPKILVLDLETAPNIAHVWGIWQANVEPMKQLRIPGRVICFGAKWHGEKRVTFSSEYHDGRDAMLTKAHEMMTEADYIVGWNSARFDMPWLRGEFLSAGLTPPAPHKDIDLMKVCKREFRFPSYKLDYVSRRVLNLPGKVSHTGHQLWIDVLEGDEETKAKAWRLMKRYQVGDVNLTDQVLERLKPWVRMLPNPALYGAEGEPEACSCGNTNLQQRGWAYTQVSRYRRYQCAGDSGCGRWLRGAKRDKGVEMRGLS